MHRRLSAPDLIGRDDESVRLREALARAAGDVPTAVFVVGEAGVGKTRLVRTFAEWARAEGARVWAGNCLADVLRAAGADLGLDRLRELAGPAAGRLASLVPELGVAAATGPPDHDSADTVDPWAGWPSVPAVMLGLWQRLAAELTVLVIEDLHWSDPSTRDILSTLIGGLRRGRLLLLFTSRDDELPRDHPLRTLLAEFGRAGADRISLSRLDHAGTAAQIAGILRAEPAAELTERVFARSGGNPFLVEEAPRGRPGDRRGPRRAARRPPAARTHAARGGPPHPAGLVPHGRGRRSRPAGPGGRDALGGAAHRAAIGGRAARAVH